MKVLFDENLSDGLIPLLAPHEVESVIGLGWRGKTYGALFAAAAERGFEVFITADRNQVYQQNLKKIPFGIVQPNVVPMDFEFYSSVSVEIIEAIERVAPGEVIAITSIHRRS